ncbi:hypothetical protein WUBG_19224, partial [Wuchereria bancrofti]
FHTDSNRKQLPALVVVHGDEYGWNSGNPYNGTILASYGQIYRYHTKLSPRLFGKIIYKYLNIK